MKAQVAIRIRCAKITKKFPRLFDVSKRIFRLIGNSDPIYECLKEFSRHKMQVSFLQIGSNDGISQDPLREFIVRHPAWSGCFVEPLPHLFKKLKRNYGYLRRKNLRYENAAVSDAAGVSYLFRIKSEYHSEFPSFVDQIASFNKSHMTTVFPDHAQIDDKIERVQVRSLPIAGLAATFRATGIDLLHLDVEGYEAVILKAFPFNSYSPEIIIFEAGHLSAEDRKAIDKLLSARGYTIFDAGIDAVALSESQTGRWAGRSLMKSTSVQMDPAVERDRWHKRVKLKKHWSAAEQTNRFDETYIFASLDRVL